MTEPAKVELKHDIQLDSVVGGVFLTRVADDGLSFVHHDGWRTAAEEPELGQPLMRISSEGRATTLCELDGALVVFGFFSGHVWAAAAAREPGPVEAVFERLRALLPPPDPSSKHEVPVTFWTYSSQGPHQSWRSIAVPGWDEIEANYATRTQRELAAIMRGFRSASGGQLILWHGPAGTGKTFALRALAWEWHEWCDFNYIVDPDAFFGQHADYLMSVLLEQPDGHSFQMIQRAGWTHYAGLGVLEVEEAAEEREPPWRLLVLEDAGELIQADARAAAGQGLSRFLNVVDGLIGQGLRVLVLVTTNEEVRRLHPAVARPGRCAANIEFAPLSTQEATAWLLRHGVDEPASAPTTLASLYARAEGREADEVVSVGFAEA